MSDSAQAGIAHSAVHYDVAGGTARITLDSPANRNALSARLMAQLAEHLAAAEADPAVRVVVLGHTGHVFCSGMDLSEAAGADAAGQGVNAFPAILQAISTGSTPVVAAVGGAARAGGIGLLAACDVVVAAETAHFALTEVRIGVIPALISVPLAHRMPPAALLELALTGERFDAVRAQEVGLVNRVVPPDDLAAEVDRYAGMLASGGPVALGAVKRLLRGPSADSDAARYAEMQALSASFFASPEGQEGIASFREKRPPAWTT